jgi:hypothetical protein
MINFLNRVVVAPNDLGGARQKGGATKRGLAVSGGANTVYFWRLQNHLS